MTIEISAPARDYFRHLLQTQGGDAVGIRMAAVHPGTPRADARLEFCEEGDLLGDEWSLDCDGFTLFVDGASMRFLEGAQVDYLVQPTGGQLTIRAPKIKGAAPAADAPLGERVQYLLDSEINPMLAAHKGNVTLDSVVDGRVLLRFGGGCQGCGMADVTLKQGIEKTLRERLPDIVGIGDATDHARGEAPYIPR
jgi:Fe/S biogenesis protein NfuA